MDDISIGLIVPKITIGHPFVQCRNSLFRDYFVQFIGEPHTLRSIWGAFVRHIAGFAGHGSQFDVGWEADNA